MDVKRPDIMMVKLDGRKRTSLYLMVLRRGNVLLIFYSMVPMYDDNHLLPDGRGVEKILATKKD